MHAQSIRQIGSQFYRPEVIERVLIEIGTLEATIIDEGHYFVMEEDGFLGGGNGRIVGSGGWSQLTPVYNLPSSKGRTLVDTAIVRAVFVDPQSVRQGIGRRVMERLEADACAQGIRRFQLTATLPGVPLYEALGYCSSARRRIILSDGSVFECVVMDKLIEPASLAA